jgi:hypothetical protein
LTKEEFSLIKNTFGNSIFLWGSPYPSLGSDAALEVSIGILYQFQKFGLQMGGLAPL